MKILVLENNKQDIDTLVEFLQYFFTLNKIDYEIEICVNGQEVLRKIFSSDLLFLDIELNDENGIELGNQLKELKHNCRIIIVSCFQNYLIEGYRIHATRYFLKPLNKQSFCIEMNDVISEYFRNEEGFFDENIQRGKIYYHDILYIENYDRKTKIHFVDGHSILCDYTLNKWQEQLKNQSFGQCFRSIYVNFEYIKNIKKNDIVLENNQIVPLSRHYRKEFYECYLNYKG